MSQNKDKVPPSGAVNEGFASEDDVTVSVSTTSQLPSKSDEESEETRCGYGPCKPKSIQCMNKMWLFVVWVVLMCFLEGFAVNGIANAGLPAIEKQYGLTSTKSALIPSSQDFGALAVVLFVSFIGGRLHKPRIVAFGSVIMGIGSFLFIVPHIAEKYDFTGAGSGPSSSGTCNGTRGVSVAPPSCDSEGERFMSVFIIAQIVHGIGFTPMFTVGTVYIDENEEHSLAAIYIGLTYAAAAVGVATGFFVGGQILQNLFVDFDRVEVDFDAKDSRWIGAWWFGFIITTIAFILIAIPIYAYPKSLPGSEKYRSATNKDFGKDLGICQLVVKLFKLFFKTVLKLLKNPVFMFLNLAGCSQTLIIAGVGAFSFKFLTEQYNLDFDTSGYLIGGLILVGSLGMFLGGLLVKLLKLEVVGMTRLNSLVTLMSALLGISFLAGCPEVPLAGLQVPYTGNSLISGYVDSCHATCDCEKQAFSTVCGSDNKVYFSPCHAGCSSSIGAGPTATYHNCTCIDGLGSAVGGRCEGNCTKLSILAPCMFLAMLCVLTAVTPTSMATLRCVDEDDKSFALGIQWLLLRLLGTIPGPVLVGWVLDKSCLLWNGGSCGSDGFCMLYSHDKMAVGIMAWWVIVSTVASILNFIASIFAVRASSSNSLDLQKGEK